MKRLAFLACSHLIYSIRWNFLQPISATLENMGNESSGSDKRDWQCFQALFVLINEQADLNQSGRLIMLTMRDLLLKRYHV
jgi:hypothetical protein